MTLAMHVMNTLEEQKEITRAYIDRKDGNKIKTGMFNAIYFDGNIKEKFNKLELCLAYIDNGTITNLTPISDILEIYDKDNKDPRDWDNFTTEEHL